MQSSPPMGECGDSRRGGAGVLPQWGSAAKPEGGQAPPPCGSPAPMGENLSPRRGGGQPSPPCGFPAPMGRNLKKRTVETVLFLSDRLVLLHRLEKGTTVIGVVKDVVTAAVRTVVRAIGSRTERAAAEHPKRRLFVLNIVYSIVKAC